MIQSARMTDIAVMPKRDISSAANAWPRRTALSADAHRLSVALVRLANCLSPSPKTSTSKTSCLRCRNSSPAIILEAIKANVLQNSACRSRWITCVESVAGFNPSFSQTARSIAGSRCACVPTAPLNFPTRILSVVCASRSSARPNSSNINASFSPKVIGSA